MKHSDPRRGGSAPAGAMKAIGARGVSLAATFLMSASVARFLGAETAGAFFLVYTIVALFATVGRFGADNLALRLMGGDTYTPRADVSRLILLVLVAGAVATALGAIVLRIVMGPYVGAGIVILVATCIFAQAAAVVCGTILRGLGMLASGVFAELGSLPLVASALIVGAEFAFSGGVTLEKAFTAMTIAAWATAAWSIPLAMRMSRRKLKDSTVSSVRTSAFFGMHAKRLASMMGTSVLAYGMTWAPVFVLSITSELSQVSYYSLALRLANIVALLPSIQVSYLAPEFARRYYSGDISGLNALAGRSAFQVGAITVVPLIVLIAFAEAIVILLFGQQFVSAAPVTIILSVAVFFVMLTGQVNQLMLLCGLEGVALLLTAGGLLVWSTVGMSISSQGAAGAAWLGASVSVLYALAASFALKRMRGIESYVRPPSLHP